VPLSPRGELELPLAVQHAMTAGRMRVRAIRTDEAVLDLSSRADIASVAKRLEGVEVRL
jgi:dTDP-glucose pyrophosphorylase